MKVNLILPIIGNGQLVEASRVEHLVVSETATVKIASIDDLGLSCREGIPFNGHNYPTPTVLINNNRASDN